ncbi:BatA domain-containing protein [Pricia sp. S334]|uniref:BatA domain-containing protein n=1 Tax=Pricia mediterranea TaxID=3076079 RepID=A0ABU3L1W4_9FLAO|nr:BatA domain-containing protein [Pricia sp. S334]MDT7827398.1 BatA domain-containing protein [Pricia sp. S334]
MVFLNPSFLWALLGIAVPLAIHLWSRKKEVTIKIGSIQLLKESKPGYSSTLRPNEWWLLMLRILTIVLLALILAGPNWNRSFRNEPIAYLVEPSLFDSDKLGKLWDTIPPDAVRLLVKGFPRMTDYNITDFFVRDSEATNLEPFPEVRNFDATDPDLTTSEADFDIKDSYTISASTMPPNYWQLAQEMTALPADSIIVFTRALVAGIKGMRSQTDRRINFVTLTDEDSSKAVLEARRTGDSLELLGVINDGMRLGFETRRLSFSDENIDIHKSGDSVTVAERRLVLRPGDSLRVLLVYADSLSRDMHYIKAAYRAISKYVQRDISVVTSEESELGKNTDPGDGTSSRDNTDFPVSGAYDFSVWLGRYPTPNDSLPALIFRPDGLADKLIEPGEVKDRYHLTERLNSENIVSGHLAEELLKLLPLHPNLEAEVAPYDRRSMGADAFRPEFKRTPDTPGQVRRMDISPWLWGVLFFIVLAERILANYRKQ